MKKLTLALLLIPFISLGQVGRLPYKTILQTYRGDTLKTTMDDDTVFFDSPTNQHYYFSGGLDADSIYTNGIRCDSIKIGNTWYRTMADTSLLQQKSDTSSYDATIYRVGQMIADSIDGIDPYTNGFGLGLSEKTFYNSRYWKGQDTIKTTLTGIVKATSGVLTAITDNSSNWDNGYTYRVTSAGGTNPMKLTLASNTLTSSINQRKITQLDSTLATGLVKVTNGTGVLSSITDNSTSWNTAYGWGNHAGLYKPIADSVNASGFGTNYKLSLKQNKYTILTTLGSLSSSAGWLYNNGSGVLSYSTPTGLISGITSGYVPYANSSTSLANSPIQTDGTYVGIGGGPGSAYQLNVTGTIYSSSSIFGTTSMRSPTLTSLSGSGSSISIFPQDKDAPFIRFGAGSDNATLTTEWARFILGGYLGLGTTTPAAKLDLFGDATYGSVIKFHNTATGATVTDGGCVGVQYSDNSVFLKNYENTATFLTTNNNDRLHILGNGNVGIDTITPEYKLDVNGDINTSGSIRVNGTAINGSQWTTSSSNIYYNSGNVGIGTSDPTYLLDVNGNIGGSNIETNPTSYTTRIGYQSGYNESEIAGSYNSFIGYRAGYSNTTGMSNIFIGANSGAGNIDGSNNIFIGNTTLEYASFNGSNNTIVGDYSGNVLSMTGYNNTYIGQYSGKTTTTGSANVFSGNQAGFNNTTGSANVFSGNQAGYNNKYGSGNVLIGNYSRMFGKNISNELVVDNQERGDASDTLRYQTTSPIYGIFNETYSNQALHFNAQVIINGTLNSGSDAGSTDAYVVSIPGLSALQTGMLIYFMANTANTGACTLNVNSLGATPLKAYHDQDPPDSYIEAGSWITVIFDGSNFQIQTPDANP
jgi:hypothetical protein